MLILSRNRQHCLKKTLSFYENYNINLLVIDNSPSDLSREFIPENCEYINTDQSFGQRSALAANRIKTKYTIIGADDEIYLPEALEKMKGFLESNSDYLAVGGYAIAVWKYGPTIASTWAYQRTYRYHNNNETPLERIKLHTGNGDNPITSFFTCNLTRTKAAQNCLNLYSKAPVVSTDAISVLTICGAGKSKYLDIVYWVRNWNQSPRSNVGWNRRVTLHEWWQEESNAHLKNKFESELKEIYLEYSNVDDFQESWNLVLKSDLALHKNISKITNQIRSLNEITRIKTIKYYLKKFFAPSMMPRTIALVCNDLRSMDIEIPELELQKASKIVSDLLPYESW